MIAARELRALEPVEAGVSPEDPVSQDLANDVEMFLDDNGLKQEEVTIELVYDSTGESPVVSYEVRTGEGILKEMSCVKGYEFTETDEELFEDYIWPEIGRYFAEDIFTDADVALVEVGGNRQNIISGNR